MSGSLAQFHPTRTNDCRWGLPHIGGSYATDCQVLTRCTHAHAPHGGGRYTPVVRVCVCANPTCLLAFHPPHQQSACPKACSIRLKAKTTALDYILIPKNTRRMSTAVGYNTERLRSFWWPILPRGRSWYTITAFAFSAASTAAV